MNSATDPTQKRVLIIDDNIDAAAMLQALLTAFGYTVEAANSGMDGIALAKRFRPHVIFLDLGMPIMDGYEVATRLRITPAVADVYLLALTGWNDQATRAAVIAAGFDRHLVKPPNLDQVLGILNEHFEALALS